MSLAPNYTVVGNPTIDGNYILTQTSDNDYLTFKEDEVFDAMTSYNIIFKVDTNNLPENQSTLFKLGDDPSVWCEYSGSGWFYFNMGSNNFSWSADSMTGDYVKVEFDADCWTLCIYTSEDGANWDCVVNSDIYSSAYLEDSNNTIGYSYSEVPFDLKEFKIISNEEIWYQAVDEALEPYLRKSDLSSITLKSSVFQENDNIYSVDCKNIPFENNNAYCAFSNCFRLCNVTNLNQNITDMSYTFAGCPIQLYETGFPTIPNSVTDISGLFSNHPEWTEFPTQAFENTMNKVPSHLKNTMAGYFDDCHSLINIPYNIIFNTATNISNTFRRCYNITDMPEIPDGVTNMSETFEGCYSLTNCNYSIPNSVIDMNYAFSSCHKLENLPDFSNANSVRYANSMFSHCYNMKNVSSLPDSIEDGSYLFYNCTNLVNVSHLPNSLTTASWIFADCTNMVDIPNFENCTNLTNMSYAFYYCFNLANAQINIPYGVTNIDSMFCQCRKLESVSTIIPNTVTSIGAIFSWDSNLINVPDIPNSVTNISMAFQGCSKLVNIPTIPNSVTNLEYTFRDCSNLVTAPNIPNTAKDMYYTFYNCSNLTGDIYIHSENITYAYGCFNNTSLTKNVYIPFKYANNVNTRTYNSLTSAGYKTDGSVCGVYLKDINQL